MCGIVATLNLKGNETHARRQVLKMARLLRHRGPDWSGIFSSEKAILAHQ